MAELVVVASVALAALFFVSERVIPLVIGGDEK